MSKRAFPISCRDCRDVAIFPRDVKSGDWIYVLDEPPYALCPSCHWAVVQSVLPSTRQEKTA